MGLKRITDLPAAGTITGLELTVISQPSASITITDTSISAAAADNSFNDANSGFVTAGFAIGDRIGVLGFTGDVANNILVGIVTSVAAGKIIVGGTDGDVIVNDAAGESVTIFKWETTRAPYGAGGGAYDILGGFGLTPITDQVLDTLPIVREITFPADFAGSVGQVGTNPTATFDVLVKDDATTIGTISISTGGVFTFTTVSNTAKVVAAGSFLSFVAPTTVDVTVADAIWTLLGEQ